MNPPLWDEKNRIFVMAPRSLSMEMCKQKVLMD